MIVVIYDWFIKNVILKVGSTEMKYFDQSFIKVEGCGASPIVPVTFSWLYPLVTPGTDAVVGMKIGVLVVIVVLELYLVLEVSDAVPMQDKLLTSALLL